MSGPELPNPFSREGSRPAEPAPESTGWADYPAPPSSNGPTALPPAADAYPSAGAFEAPGGYGSNPYEPAPYPPGYPPAYGGYSPYGYVATQHPQAVVALVLGIAGVVICPFVGIAGLVVGRRARREIDAEPGRYSGRGQATAGFVLGIVSIAVGVLWIAYFAVLIGLIGASSGFDNF